MKQQPEFGLSEVYIDNHMALLPELKLEKRNTSEIAKHGQTQGESLGQTPDH